MIGEKLPRTTAERVAVSGELWNRLMDRIERLERLTVAPPLMLADNGTGRVLSVVRTAGGGRLYRMRVTNANPGVSGLVLARNWDGTNESGAEVPVKAVQGHPPGGELYAMQVVGNTDASYSGQPVAWLEWLVLPVSTIPYRVVQVIDTAGRLGVESVALE